jgi:hypothetical protein
MGQQLNIKSKLKKKVGVEKSKFKRLYKFFILDPKPGDLIMNRLKLFEKIMEDWTRVCGKRLGWFVIRGERLIKLGDSWFSTKSI